MLNEPYRRLSAIMITDMVGYSMLTRRNETAALRALDLYRHAVREALAAYAGTEIKTMGDGFLVEFGSTMDSVNCGVAIQKAMHAINAGRPDNAKIFVRIGIHIGEVMHKEDDVFGDGVNVAARIEPLADPGGVFFSEDLARQISSEFDLPYELVDRSQLKDAAILIGIYRVVLPWAGDEARPCAKTDAPGWSRRRALAMAAIVAVACIGIGAMARALWTKGGHPRDVNGQAQAQRQEAVLDASELPAADASLGNGALPVGITEAMSDSPGYDLYLRGRMLWNTGQADGFRKATELFSEATRTDPQFATAWAALAQSYSFLGRYSYGRPSDAFPQARVAAARAIKLDDASGEAHAAMAMAMGCYEWDGTGATAEMERALNLAPDNPAVRESFAYWLVINGDIDAGLEEMQKAIALDPLNVGLAVGACYLQFAVGRHDDLIQQAAVAAEGSPDNAEPHFYLGLAYQGNGMSDEAEAQFRSGLELAGSRQTHLTGLIAAYAGAGRYDEALALLGEMTTATDGEYVSPAVIAGSYAALGDFDSAFEWLDAAGRERVPELLFLNTWPQYQPLRSDSRWPELLRSLGVEPATDRSGRGGARR